MWNQPTVLLRAGRSSGQYEAVEALRSAGFRVLLPEDPTAEAVEPDLIIRHFDVGGSESNGGRWQGAPSTVPVLSLDLVRVEPLTLVDLALRVLGRRPPRRWGWVRPAGARRTG